ncbi:hypothetical protein U1Q18_047297 [Sarracenia purpurea var. burkii]
MRSGRELVASFAPDPNLGADLAGAVDDGVTSVPYRRLNAGQYVAYFLWFLRLMWPFAMMLWWLLPCAGRCRSGRGPI